MRHINSVLGTGGTARGETKWDTLVSVLRRSRLNMDMRREAYKQCAGYGRHRTKRKEKKQVNETKQHQFHTAYHVFTRTTIL
jgi:hypothetical protein